VSLEFGIFGLSWTSTDLTRGSVRMTHGSLYMTWPNDRMTHGSMTCGCTKLTWQGDWVVQKLTWQGD
jgi:hypothetical protein